jgi:hypothetical protein
MFQPVNSGHHVAYIRNQDAGWLLFNDEKVVHVDKDSVHALVHSRICTCLRGCRTPPWLDAEGKRVRERDRLKT